MRLLLIDEENLNLLFRPLFTHEGVIAGITGVVTGLAAFYNSENLIACILCVAAVILEAYHAIHVYRKRSLLKEIIDMDQTAHHHSIIVIKDSYAQYPNRFLVYFDERWQCRLFPNYPTQQTVEANTESIRKRLSGDLHIPLSCIHLEKKAQVLQEKYSPKHARRRVYDHTFYVAKIDQFPIEVQQKDFEIQGCSYSWMTISEMQNDPAIIENNLDVVDVVNKLNA